MQNRASCFVEFSRVANEGEITADDHQSDFALPQGGRDRLNHRMAGLGAFAVEAPNMLIAIVADREVRVC